MIIIKSKLLLNNSDGPVLFKVYMDNTDYSFTLNDDSIRKLLQCMKNGKELPDGFMGNNKFLLKSNEFLELFKKELLKWDPDDTCVMNIVKPNFNVIVINDAKFKTNYIEETRLLKIEIIQDDTVHKIEIQNIMYEFFKSSFHDISLFTMPEYQINCLRKGKYYVMLKSGQTYYKLDGDKVVSEFAKSLH